MNGQQICLKDDTLRGRFEEMKIAYCLEPDAFQTGCRFHAIRVQRLDVMALKIRYYIT